MNKKQIEGQLKLSKKQNEDERSDYLCSQFNCVDYLIKLEKYTNNLLRKNKKQQEVIDKVINIAYEYGQIDGAHHKTWVIDQMIRELLGTEYDKFIKEYEEDGEYTWDIGIAP